MLLTSVAFVVAAVTLARRQGAGAGAPRRGGPRPRRRGVPGQDRHADRGRDRRSTTCSRSPARTAEATATRAGRARRARRRREPQRHAGGVGRRVRAPAGWRRTDAVPFSSARKWSAAAFDRARQSGSSARPRWCSPTARDPVRRARRRARGERAPGAGARAHRRAARGGGAARRRSTGRAGACSRSRSGPTPRRRCVLPRAGRGAQGHLRRQPAHGGRGRPRASGFPAPATRGFDARELPEDPEELADVLEAPLGVRAGHPAAEAGHGRRRSSRRATWWR